MGGTVIKGDTVAVPSKQHYPPLSTGGAQRDRFGDPS